MEFTIQSVDNRQNYLHLTPLPPGRLNIAWKFQFTNSALGFPERLLHTVPFSVRMTNGPNYFVLVIMGNYILSKSSMIWSYPP
jgi:hypothetical protein